MWMSVRQCRCTAYSAHTPHHVLLALPGSTGDVDDVTVTEWILSGSWADNHKRLVSSFNTLSFTWFFTLEWFCTLIFFHYVLWTYLNHGYVISFHCIIKVHHLVPVCRSHKTNYIWTLKNKHNQKWNYKMAGILIIRSPNILKSL